MVGDARSAEDVLLLLGDERVDMVFTDPPYGVSYEGGTDESLTIQNDALDPVDLEGLLRESFTLALGACRPGAGWYVTAPGAPPTSEAFHHVLSDLGIWRQTCIWVKDRFVLGRSDYHYRHEDLLVGAAPGEEPPDLPPLKLNAYEERHEAMLYGWKPGAAHTGPPDRRQDTVWEFDRPSASRDHPTMKPVDLIIRAVENTAPVGGLVLDMFAGSGSTLIACHTARRFARLLELDARYADVICARYQEHTGTKPINGLTGESVDFSDGG